MLAIRRGGALDGHPAQIDELHALRWDPLGTRSSDEEYELTGETELIGSVPHRVMRPVGRPRVEHDADARTALSAAS